MEAEPFRSLTRDEYLSPEVLERETQLIFQRQWTYAAHVSQLRSAGDFVTLRIGSQPVLVVRGADGALSSMANVCRHRGSLIEEREFGCGISQLVCPYHQWAYDLDGTLRGVPGPTRGMDLEGLRLKEYAVVEWNGLVLINLDRGAPSPAPLLDGLAGDEFAAFDVARAKIIAVHDIEVAANWKLVVENYSECYHSAANHRTLVGVMDLRQIFADGAGDVGPAPRFLPGALEPAGGARTISVDGNYVSRRLLLREGLDPADAPPSAGFGLHPALTWAQFWHDYGVVHTVRPITVETAQFTTTFFVHEDAVEGRDYEVADVTKAWDVTNDEDVRLVERNHLGVRSRAYEPGPNSVEREPILGRWLASYRDIMAGGPSV